VAVFLKKYQVSRARLGRVVVVDRDEVHFLCEPSSNTTTENQVNWALLMALKSALL